MGTSRPVRPGIVFATVATVVAAVIVAVLVLAKGSTSIDDTQVGGTISGDRMHQVFGHLFDGVATMHVTYASNGAQAGPKREADIILGPPVQAKVTMTTTSSPPQTATVIVKDNKAYLHPPNVGSAWMLMSSADDGVSTLPGLGQTAFELAFLGPRTVAVYKGSATVDGHQTREYALQIGPATSATPSASGSPSAAPAVAPHLVATLWIDTAGRLIQFAYSPTGQGDWVTATYSNWGEPLTVEAPPSKDVKVLSGAVAP